MVGADPSGDVVARRLFGPRKPPHKSYGIHVPNRAPGRTIPCATLAGTRAHCENHYSGGTRPPSCGNEL